MITGNALIDGTFEFARFVAAIAGLYLFFFLASIGREQWRPARQN